MAVILILMIIGFSIYLSFNLYINHIIELYLQNQKNKHLKPLGLDEKNFIGLHKKELEIENGYMIYARKTTAYKGVILFCPDWQLTYRFYLPLLNFLCRQGYIIVTHQNEYTFYTQSIKDLENLYNYIINDDILSTYPLACLGHGTGSLIQLSFHQAKILTKVGFQPIALEIDEIMKFSKKDTAFIRQTLSKIIQKKYQFDINLQPTLSTPTYLIYGDEDEKNTYTLQGASVKILNGLGHYPFLNMDSEQHIKSLEYLLNYPKTSQFDYNKAIETFDTSVLSDLNQNVLDILPYLFDDQDTAK